MSEVHGTIHSETPSAPPILAPPIMAPSGPAESNQTSAKRFWGTWATLGLGIALLLAHIIAQSLVVIPFVLVSEFKGQRIDVDSLATNGLVLSMATLIATPVSIGLAVALSRAKVGSWSKAWVALGFRRISAAAIIGSLLTLAGILLLWTGYARVMNLPDMPEVMVEMYRTAGFYPALWLAIIVAAPFSEEILFRGFFFAGLRHARVGPVLAIVLPSVLWAVVHLQYGLGEIGFIFVFGLALGALRMKTNSLWPPILVHSLSNLLSTVEVACITAGGQ